MRHFPLLLTHPSFNTQPPEGGWKRGRLHNAMGKSFNTQPPEGGWIRVRVMGMVQAVFQHTAARRRLAAPCEVVSKPSAVSTHSRPKAAGL